jgi:hypothetical protein
MRRPEEDEAPPGGNQAGPESNTGAAPGASKSSVVHIGKRHIYRLTTPFRTFRMDIRETPHRIKCVLRCSRVGVLGDEFDLFVWIRQIDAYMRRFDADRRPVDIVHPYAGLVSTAYGTRPEEYRSVFSTDDLPSYARDVVALRASLGHGTHEISVYHDDGCPELRGTGPCNCDAVVRYGLPDGRGVH